MPATGARRGHLAYHWRHGWIPLDHFAALSKAHHSKSGAVKVMQKHGIDVPKGYSSDHKAAPQHPAARTHPIGATVAARQPGIDNETHGRVVGHASNGMLQVGYSDRKGNPVVGTFNPSHTRVIASGATTAEPHPAPHTLKPGEHATVRGIDHMGQPMTLTGKVMSNGEVSSFAKGRTTGGHPLRSISVERQDGSRRSNVVYVPDPNRSEQKRQTNSQGLAAARAETQRSQQEHLRAAAVAHGTTKPQPSAGDLSDAAAQWKRENPGETIAGHEREVSRIADRLAERKFVSKNSTGDTAAQHAAERARIKAAMASPQTTINRLAAEKAGGASSRAKVRDLPPEGNFSRSHSEVYKGEKITVRKTEWGKHETLINGRPFAAGYGSRNKHAVTELDQARKSIDVMKSSNDPKYHGLYGMKTEPKTSPAPTHSAGMDPHAIRATQLREAAAKKRAEADRIAGSVGAPDRAGAMLRAKDSARMNARMDSGLRRFTERQREASALESKAHLAEGRSKTAAEKQAAADLAVTPSKLSPGDLIQHKGSAHMVTKVNKTTVSVPSIVGGPWEDKLPIAGISKHVPIAQMKDSNLQAMYAKAVNHPKLRATYAAELKRRGLLTGN